MSEFGLLMAYATCWWFLATSFMAVAHDDTIVAIQLGQTTTTPKPTISKAQNTTNPKIPNTTTPKTPLDTTTPKAPTDTTTPKAPPDTSQENPPDTTPKAPDTPTTQPIQTTTTAATSIDKLLNINIGGNLFSSGEMAATISSTSMTSSSAGRPTTNGSSSSVWWAVPAAVATTKTPDFNGPLYDVTAVTIAKANLTRVVTTSATTLQSDPWDDSLYHSSEDFAENETVLHDELSCNAVSINSTRMMLLDAVHHCDNLNQSLIFIDASVSADEDSTIADLFRIIKTSTPPAGPYNYWVTILRPNGNWTYSVLNLSKPYAEARSESILNVSNIIAGQNSSRRGVFLLDFINFFNATKAVACTTCQHARLGRCRWPDVLHGTYCHSVNLNATNGIFDLMSTNWGCNRTNKTSGKLATIPDAWEHAFFALIQDYYEVAAAWFSLYRRQFGTAVAWYTMENVLLDNISYRGDVIHPLSNNSADQSFFAQLVRVDNYTWNSVATDKQFPALCVSNHTACK